MIRCFQGGRSTMTSNSATAPVADRHCNSEIANTCLSLRARNVGRIDSTEIRPAHTDARPTPPVARPRQRAASEPFPAAGRPRVQEPALPSDFQVPQLNLVLSLDREIPSDLSLLDGAVAEITAAIGRTSCWRTPSLLIWLREKHLLMPSFTATTATLRRPPAFLSP